MSENRIISETPVELRPYEKCEALGPEYLSDPELLGVIIKSGTNRISAVALAEKLLYPEGKRIGLNRLLRSTLSELMEVKGIGRVKAIQLVCLGELARRMAEEKAEEQFCARTPSTVADYYMQRLKNLSEEEVYLMLLDTRNRLIRSLLISRGTVNCSALSPREIFIQALSYKAAAVILVHNHPSGDPEPSPEDIQFTRLLKSLGDMLNIPLRDSVIIGDNLYCSLEEKGLI